MINMHMLLATYLRKTVFSTNLLIFCYIVIMIAKLDNNTHIVVLTLSSAVTSGGYV